MEIPIPVYFTYEDEALLQIFGDLNSSAEKDKNSSVAALLYSMVSGYSYQVVTNVQKEAQSVKDTHFSTLVVSLLCKNRIRKCMLLCNMTSGKKKHYKTQDGRNIMMC